MRRQGSKNKLVALVAVVAGCVVALAAGYFVLIAPQRSEATELADQIAAMEAKIGTTRIEGRAKPVSLRFAELFSLTKAMPDHDDMPNVLLELSRIADGTGIVFNSISPSATETGEGYRRVPLEVVFEGSFYQLSDFLLRLRRLVAVRDGVLDARGRLFSVDSVEFAEGSESFPQLLATVKMSAFVYDESARAGEPGSSTPAPTPPAVENGSTSEGAPTAVGATP